MEEWRDIKGYEGLYQVSNEGRVKSLDRVVMRGEVPITRREQIRKAVKTDDSGHSVVRLFKNGKYQNKKIHNLVASAFIPNPNGYATVHHKDHNPLNNFVENLEWMSFAEHSSLHCTEKFSIKVYQYTLDGELVKIWNSAMEAEREGGFLNSHINECCRGGYYRKGKWINKRQYKGYRWSYTPLN